MPVRVTIAGSVFETDTVTEAIDIHRALTQESVARTPPDVVKTVAVNGKPALAFGEEVPAGELVDRRLTVPRIITFIDMLNENGQKIIRALAKYPDGLGTDELAHSISLPSMSLPPVMRHVRIMAARADLDADRVLRRVQVVINGKPKSRYRLAEEVIKEMSKEE